MNGYLERLVRRGLGRAAAATLRPRGDAGAAEELPGSSTAEVVEVTEEGPGEVPASGPQAEAAAHPSPAAAGTSAVRLSGEPTAIAVLLSRPQSVASDRDGATATPSLAAGREPTARRPVSDVRAGPPSAATPPAAERDPPATSDAPPTTAPAVATAREANPFWPQASRPPAEAPLDRTAVESPATAVVARRLAVEPGIAPSWAASARRLDDVRLAGNGEARIEVHIDRVEVVQSTPPPPPTLTVPQPRPRQRGFAGLAATRGHARRRWY